MKKFSFLKYSALCLVAWFSVVVITSCDKDGPEEPDAPVIPENPENPDSPGESEIPEDPYEEVDHMKILDFDGKYLTRIGGMYIDYTDYDRGSIYPNKVTISYRDFADIIEFSLNYKKKNFDDGEDIDITEYWVYPTLDFTPQGFLSRLYKERRTGGRGNTYSSLNKYTDEMAFTYEGGNRLSSILIVDGYEHSLAVYNAYYELKNEDIQRKISQEEISLTWDDNDNIVKIVKVEKYIEESLKYYFGWLEKEERNETSETTVYEIEYDYSTLNSARQYPWFVSSFIMSDDRAKTVFPMIGVLGKFSKNMPVKVTITKNDGEIETNEVVFTQIKVNGFNVIATECYKGETFEYLYE